MRFCFYLLAALLLCRSGLLFAADLSQMENSSVPVELEADQLTQNRDTGVYRATGDVRLKQGDIEVRGQSLQWNQLTGDIEADSGIKVISPDEELTGSSATYNIVEGTGTINDGSIFLREQNMYIQGTKIERLGESDFRIEQGTFTTCDGDVPSWKFGASKMDVTLGGYARARNMIFYLKDIPSLYFPYMVYPAKTERESGLLIPSAGYSDKRGFVYNAAYYQVLGVNQDATLYLDYLSNMGIGKGLEYRYIFGRENAGEARVYHIEVDEVDGEVVDEDRYALEWDHKGTLPGGVQMIVDAEYVNNKDYFSDFGGVAGEYNKDTVESVFSLTRNWGKYSLSGQMKYTKNLKVDTDTTLQLLPRVSFDVARTRLGESIFSYSFESEYTHFWRREGLTGERFMVRPVLSADFQLWDVISVTPQASYRERFYWGRSDDGNDDNIGIPEFSNKITTRIQRIYGGLLGASKLRHSLEPEITYRFIPDQDQSDLPSFDSYDRIEKKNEIETALIQKLTARFDQEDQNPTYRDLLYLRLGWIHQLSDQATTTQFEKLRTELILKPAGWFTFDADVTYDLDASEWDKVSADLDFGRSDGNRIGFDYRYDRDSALLDGTNEYGAVNLSVAFLKPVYLNYEQRYDFVSDEPLEQVVGLEYRQQCWSAMVSFTDRPVDESQSVMFTFTLLGLGTFGGQ